jgi:hypothetical protein
MTRSLGARDFFSRGQGGRALELAEWRSGKTMAVGDPFGDRGPQVRYARVEDLEARAQAKDTLEKALDLARTIEELLEDTRSVAAAVPVDDARTHSTRMARAMAASLVDELDALVRPARKTGSS